MVALAKRPRFSKSTMSDHLYHMMKELEDEHGFKPGDGYSVVLRGNDSKRKIAFGRYDAVRELLEAIDGGYL